MDPVLTFVFFQYVLVIVAISVVFARWQRGCSCYHQHVVIFSGKSVIILQGGCQNASELR